MRPGERIGDYTIASKIGEGGMSIVYVAERMSDGTRVVVKELKEQHQFNPQLVDRFLREATILQSLRHPNLARVFDVLRHDGLHYIIQEYLSGGSLADLLREKKRYSEQEAIRWCSDALRAMNYAHENRIVHRDLKPSNLMLDDQRQIRVIDFGIARAFGQERLTRTSDGSIGTLEYMSPEQILTPNQIDHLTDVYSMGIVLYELLSGSVPFEGTPFSVQEKIARQPPPPLTQLGRGVVPLNPNGGGINPKLARIVFQALEKRPERRFGGCAEFALQLERHLAQRTKSAVERPALPKLQISLISRRSRGLAIAGVVGVVAVAVTLVLGGGSQGGISDPGSKDPESTNPSDVGGSGAGIPSSPPDPTDDVLTKPVPPELSGGLEPEPGPPAPPEPPGEPSPAKPAPPVVPWTAKKLFFAPGVAGESAAQPGLQYQVLRVTEDGGEVDADPRSVFRSGDRIRLSIQPNIDGHLYVIQRGASGAWGLLFPNSGINGGRNAVSAHRRYTIPRGTNTFRFDDTAGTESLFIVLSRSGVPELPSFIPQNVRGPTIQQGLVDNLRTSLQARDLVLERVDDAASANEEGNFAVNNDAGANAITVSFELEHR